MGLGVNEPVDGSLYAFWYATMHLTLAHAHNVDMLNGYCYQQVGLNDLWISPLVDSPHTVNSNKVTSISLHVKETSSPCVLSLFSP